MRDYMIKGLSNTSQMLTFNGRYVDTSLENVNYALAYKIYMFLEGRRNSLPAVNVVNDLIEKSNGSIVSLACGVLVLNNDGDIKIEIEEPVTKKCSRFDVISCDEYKAYFRRGTDINDEEEINVQEMPRYDIRRIEILKSYLSSCRDMKKEDVPSM